MELSLLDIHSKTPRQSLAKPRSPNTNHVWALITNIKFDPSLDYRLMRDKRNGGTEWLIATAVGWNKHHLRAIKEEIRRVGIGNVKSFESSAGFIVVHQQSKVKLKAAELLNRKGLYFYRDKSRILPAQATVSDRGLELVILR